MADAELPASEIERVRKELFWTLKESLSSWARTRFWIAAIVVGAVTLFGVRGLVQQVFDEDLAEIRKETLDIIVKAETATALATDAATKVKAAAEQVRTEINALNAAIARLGEEAGRYASSVSDLQKRAEQADSAFNKLEVRIASARTSSKAFAKGSVETVISRLASLEATVADMADQVDYRTPEGKQVGVAQVAVQKKSEEKLTLLKENSEYTIWIRAATISDNSIIQKIEGLLDENGYALSADHRWDKEEYLTLSALSDEFKKLLLDDEDVWVLSYSRGTKDGESIASKIQEVLRPILPKIRLIARETLVPDAFSLDEI